MAKTKGPPRLMTQDDKDYICQQIAAGRAVSDILEKKEVGVESRTIYREMARDPAFMASYARARETAIEIKIGETEDIILGRGDYAGISFEERKELVNDRRWFAIRLQRNRYGDKIDLDVKANVQVEGKVIDVEALDYDQLVAFRQALQIASGAEIDDDDEDYTDYEEVDDGEGEGAQED